MAYCGDVETLSLKRVLIPRSHWSYETRQRPKQVKAALGPHCADQSTLDLRCQASIHHDFSLLSSNKYYQGLSYCSGFITLC